MMFVFWGLHEEFLFNSRRFLSNPSLGKVHNAVHGKTCDSHGSMAWMRTAASSPSDRSDCVKEQRGRFRFFPHIGG